MEETLQKILAFPPAQQKPFSDEQYDDAIKTQIQFLKDSEKKLLQKTPDGESLLDLIDPATHSIAYLFILRAYIAAVKKNSKVMDWRALWEKISYFLGEFDGRQVRYGGVVLDEVLHVMVETARDNNQTTAAVSPLARCILQLDPSGSVLTSRHLTCVQLALETASYNDALPILDKFVYHFPGGRQLPMSYIGERDLSPAAYFNKPESGSHKFKHEDVADYFYNGALVYIGLKQWEDALEYLESVITYPSKDNSFSKMMLEAYKKWVLVGVLARGKALPLPKTLNSKTQTAYHTLGKAYDTLAGIFENGTASRLRNEVDNSILDWRDDQNYGLVCCLLAAYQKNQIRNLADVYSKISIPEIRDLTTSAESGAKLNATLVEGIIQNMVQSGELLATVTHLHNGVAVLNFAIDGPASNLTETEMKRELETTKSRIEYLTNQVKQTDKILNHDKEYIKFAHKMKKTPKSDQGVIAADIVDEEVLMEGVDYS